VLGKYLGYGIMNWIKKTGRITHEDSNWLGQMLIVPLWQVNDICDDLRD